MKAIKVSNFIKHYQIYRKEEGLIQSIKSVFFRGKEIVEAVKGISFDIEKGELVGFIGPNGAGKTTTLKCLSGILSPTKGDISVLGHEPFARKEEFLKNISLVMGQKNQLWWDLPSNESFLLNKEIYNLSDKEYKKNLSELVELLEVGSLLDVPARKLSLGQRMKMELIAALIHAPKVLFLDEPTIGLDVVMQRKMRNFISEYNSRKKSTIVLTSHYMSDVKELCKRVIIIDDGRLIYDGLLSELVKKYADSKKITVAFKDKVAREKLEKIGQIRSYMPERAVLTISREKSNQAAASLLSKFDVEDLNIEDPEIEDIIEEVFTPSK